MTETVIRHCAPTLAGLKSGSLFSCERDRAGAWLDAMRPLMNAGKVEATLIEVCAKRALLYVYRPSRLAADFAQAGVRDFLARYGYDADDVPGAVDRLRERLAAADVFPHEVGLFLGYPLSDVTGFIEHAGRAYKCCGCWKVYGDVELAERAFRQYKVCTRALLSGYHSGRSFGQLIVAC